MIMEDYIIDEYKLKSARKYIKHRSKSNRNINDYYTILEEIEMDCYSGVIYKVKCNKTNRIYIVKRLDKIRSAYKEIYIQKYLNSDAIIKIKDIFFDNDSIWLVIKYANDGDLFDMFKHRTVSYFQAINIINQISLLLKYVHSNGIIHGDIKMENILLDRYKIYLSDFGFSVFATNPKTKICVYTNPYTAPEQLHSLLFDFKSDVWSLGIILYILCFDDYPFGYEIDKEYEPDEMYLMINENKLNIPISCPIKLSDLIKGMLEIDLNKRFSLDQVREKLIKF